MINALDAVDSFVDPNSDSAHHPNLSLFPEDVTADGSLAPRVWGSFCFDLAVNPAGHEAVCFDYGITPEALGALLERKPFVDRLRDAALQVKALGPSAGFVLSARMAAEKHLVTLNNIAEDTNVNTAIRVRVIENLVRYAHMDPSVQKSARDDGKPNSPGVLVQLNIGAGLLGPSSRIIELKTPDADET
jgi:hypothetical protein